MSTQKANTNTPATSFAPDCRHYKGDKPCHENRLCRGCDSYEPWAQRICIIKFGALGDVLRTVCILPHLRKQHPNAHITWVSKPNGCRLLAKHDMIDRVLPFDASSSLVLANERFDLVINLDKEPEPCALAKSLTTDKLLGITLSDHGTPVPANDEAISYFELGLSDELKFVLNTYSYPNLIYNALGWDYEGQKYDLPVDESLADHARVQLAERGWKPSQPTVGINVGAGRTFANKMWPADRIVDVIALLKALEPNMQVLLLGGPDEKSVVRQITELLIERDLTAGVIDAGCEHEEQAFVTLVSACDVLFCGDTMAMHVAVATDTRVVAYLGPTCEQEIDLFDLGDKLVADVSCGPCYKRHCDHDDACVKAISDGAAAEAIIRQLTHLEEEKLSEKPTKLSLPIYSQRDAA